MCVIDRDSTDPGSVPRGVMAEDVCNCHPVGGDQEAVTRPGVCTTAPDKEPRGSPNASGAQGRAGLGHSASRAPSGPRFSLACFFFFLSQDWSVLCLEGRGGCKAKLIFKEGRNGFAPTVGIFPSEAAAPQDCVLNRAIEFRQPGMDQPSVDSLRATMRKK